MTSLVLAYWTLGGLAVAIIASVVIGVVIDRTFTARQRVECPQCEAEREQ